MNLGSDLTAGQKDQLLSLLKSFYEVHPTDTCQLGHCWVGNHHIDTSNHAPVKQRIRRSSRWAQEGIEKPVQQMLEMGVIVECESEWASNCVVVFRKDKTARVCIDYRGLNSVTRKDCYPVCDIQALFDCLHGSSFYTSLDLYSGYD